MSARVNIAPGRLVRRRILIVENDMVLSRLLHDLLVQEGSEVAVARDAASALVLADSFAPDLIVLDVVLPGGNGFDLCTRWRHTSQAAIVLLTGRSGSVDRARGMAAGAADYITKPFAIDDLMARLSLALHRRPNLRVM